MPIISIFDSRSAFVAGTLLSANIFSNFQFSTTLWSLLYSPGQYSTRKGNFNLSERKLPAEFSQINPGGTTKDFIQLFFQEIPSSNFSIFTLDNQISEILLIKAPALPVKVLDSVSESHHCVGDEHKLCLKLSVFLGQPLPAVV